MPASTYPVVYPYVAHSMAWKCPQTGMQGGYKYPVLTILDEFLNEFHSATDFRQFKFIKLDLFFKSGNLKFQAIWFCLIKQNTAIKLLVQSIVL